MIVVMLLGFVIEDSRRNFNDNNEIVTVIVLLLLLLRLFLIENMSVLGIDKTDIKKDYSCKDKINLWKNCKTILIVG